MRVNRIPTNFVVVVVCGPVHRTNKDIIFSLINGSILIDLKLFAYRFMTNENNNADAFCCILCFDKSVHWILDISKNYLT